MRMRKIVEAKERPTLEAAAKEFLAVKQAQMLSDETMHDYQAQLERFVCGSRNSTEYSLLEQDTLAFFAAIPDTSPARYNKPYQYISAFFNWMVRQEYIPKNPITANELKKRRDEGNIKPVSVSDLQRFMNCLDRKSYTGMRTYTIVLVMMDCGIRTKELLGLRDSDFNAMEHTLRVSKTVAKTRRERLLYLSPQTAKAVATFIRMKPEEWENWLFPNYEGSRLTTTYLDKDFAKVSRLSGVKITPYQLRHSFATLYLQNGGDLFTLQKQMGHSDLRMTKRYTEIDDGFLQLQHIGAYVNCFVEPIWEGAFWLGRDRADPLLRNAGGLKLSDR